MGETQLKHYGVKGMRWGVRKSAQELRVEAKKAAISGREAKAGRLARRAAKMDSRPKQYRERMMERSSKKTADRRGRIINGKAKVSDYIMEIGSTSILDLARGGGTIKGSAKRKDAQQRSNAKAISQGKATLAQRASRNIDLAMNTTYLDLIKGIKK